jgi:cobalt/nickel transport system ATP-binding protein
LDNIVTIKSLEVSELAFAYPDGHQALFGVNLSLEKGERVALLGPNGAGKTTLVMHLNGILPTMQGSVRVGGTLVDANDKAGISEIRHKVGIVFQDPDDQLFMPTVGEDVAFGPYTLACVVMNLRRQCARLLNWWECMNLLIAHPTTSHSVSAVV